MGNNKQYLEQALELCEKERIFEELEKYGKPLFLMVSGAHNFGFPSKDSDIDIRGVYYSNSKNFFDIKPKEQKVFEFMSGDRKLDVSVDELRHYLQLVNSSNGNRIEWPFSDLIIYQSSHFNKLRACVNENALSKQIFNHYLNFARDMWSGKTKAEGVKKDLYALRVYMTGITILEEGHVCSNIVKLNERFGEQIINPMLKIKYSGENGAARGYDRRELGKVIQSLDERLIYAHQNSNLQNNSNIEALNTYHQEFRIEKL